MTVSPGVDPLTDGVSSLPAARDQQPGAPPSRPLLGEILIANRCLTRAKLEDALLKQRVSGKRLGALLVELGAVNERDLATALGQHFGVAVVDLRRESPEPQAVARVDEARARELLALPLRETEGVLEVAVADPTDQLQADLETAVNSPVALLVASATDIRRAIDRSYRALAGVHHHVEAFQANAPELAAGSPASAAVDESAPVVQVVTMVLAQALRDRASDVHIEPLDTLTRVRFRIDGVLHDVLTLPGAMGGAVVSRLKVLAGMNIVERRRAQDGQFTTDVEGRNLDIRVSSAGTVGGEKVVLRLLDKSTAAFSLPDLGMPAATYDVFSTIIRAPFGMLVCAGPTGSGKTTSLYAALGELNGTERNIMTIEDPVEYVVPSINQIQINEPAGVDFAGGLRSILRQDPDVILVGEVRDTETARIAVQAALTGHFVMTSLHATDTTSALLRLLDMDIEPYVVGSAVTGLLSQRLVRRICEHCRRRVRPTAAEFEFLAEAGGEVPRGGLWQGEGCTFCSHTGYQDRIGVYELLRMTPAMGALLTAQPDHTAIRALAAQEGTRSLRQEAVRLVSEGTTTIAEVLRGIYSL